MAGRSNPYDNYPELFSGSQEIEAKIIETNNDNTYRVLPINSSMEIRKKNTIDGNPTDECIIAYQMQSDSNSQSNKYKEGDIVELKIENGDIGYIRGKINTGKRGVPGENKSKGNFPSSDGIKGKPKSQNREKELIHRANQDSRHKLATGNWEDTPLKAREENKTKNVEIATKVDGSGGGTWDEPSVSDSYGAEHPYNTVIATESGIVIEMDSTPGSSRINIQHPSGTFVEMSPDGNMIIKNQNDRYEITVGNQKVKIDGNLDVNITSDESHKIGGDKITEVGGNRDEQIGEDTTIDIGNNKKETIGGNKTDEITGNWDSTNQGTVTIIGSTINLNP